MTDGSIPPPGGTVVIELDQFQLALLHRLRTERALTAFSDADLALDLVREYLADHPTTPVGEDGAAPSPAG